MGDVDVVSTALAMLEIKTKRAALLDSQRTLEAELLRSPVFGAMLRRGSTIALGTYAIVPKLLTEKQVNSWERWNLLKIPGGLYLRVTVEENR